MDSLRELLVVVVAGLGFIVALVYLIMRGRYSREDGLVAAGGLIGNRDEAEQLARQLIAEALRTAGESEGTSVDLEIDSARSTFNARTHPKRQEVFDICLEELLAEQ
jgi:hypothetical protein